MKPTTTKTTTTKQTVEVDHGEWNASLTWEDGALVNAVFHSPTGVWRVYHEDGLEWLRAVAEALRGEDPPDESEPPTEEEKPVELRWVNGQLRPPDGDYPQAWAYCSHGTYSLYPNGGRPRTSGGEGSEEDAVAALRADPNCRPFVVLS